MNSTDLAKRIIRLSRWQPVIDELERLDMTPETVLQRLTSNNPTVTADDARQRLAQLIERRRVTSAKDLSDDELAAIAAGNS